MLKRFKSMSAEAEAAHTTHGIRDQGIGERRGGGGVYSIFMHGRIRIAIGYGPSHSYYAGTEHVGFSPTRHTLLAPITKRGGSSASPTNGELHPTTKCLWTPAYCACFLANG